MKPSLNPMLMNDHAYKLLISAIAVLLGYSQGWHYIAQINPDPGAWISVFRSVLVGGGSWIGMMAMKTTYNFAVKRWKKYKANKKSSNNDTI